LELAAKRAERKATMLSRSWAALTVLALGCAATHAPPPGDYLDDDSMIRRGRIALADAPATQACVDVLFVLGRT
jgi:hypothetical protein